MRVKSIEIDLGVHKAIEARRRTFEETHNEILRRVLEVDEIDRGERDGPALPTARVRGRGIFLTGRVVLPNGTRLRFRYRGEEHLAEVRDGRIWLNNMPFRTPSGAAMSVTKNNVNGWRLWQVRRPDDSEWLVLDSLRRNTG